jgi:hypothetical protein
LLALADADTSNGVAVVLEACDAALAHQQLRLAGTAATPELAPPSPPLPPLLSVALPSVSVFLLQASERRQKAHCVSVSKRCSCPCQTRRPHMLLGSPAHPASICAQQATRPGASTTATGGGAAQMVCGPIIRPINADHCPNLNHFHLFILDHRPPDISSYRPSLTAPPPPKPPTPHTQPPYQNPAGDKLFQYQCSDNLSECWTAAPTDGPWCVRAGLPSPQPLLGELRRRNV